MWATHTIYQCDCNHRGHGAKFWGQERRRSLQWIRSLLPRTRESFPRAFDSAQAWTSLHPLLSACPSPCCSLTGCCVQVPRKHYTSKTLTQANALSRRSEHDKRENDNKDVIILEDKLFAKSNSAALINETTSEISQIKLEKEEEFIVKAVNIELQKWLHSCEAKELNAVPYTTSTGKQTF